MPCLNGDIFIFKNHAVGVEGCFDFNSVAPLNFFDGFNEILNFKRGNMDGDFSGMLNIFTVDDFALEGYESHKLEDKIPVAI